MTEKPRTTENLVKLISNNYNKIKRNLKYFLENQYLLLQNIYEISLNIVVMSLHMTMPKLVGQQLFLSDLMEGITCARNYLICTSGNNYRSLMNRCRVLVDCKNNVANSNDCNSLRQFHYYIRFFNLHLMNEFYYKQLKQTQVGYTSRLNTIALPKSSFIYLFIFILRRFTRLK